MKLSVVVPAFNEEKLIAQTLAAISAALSPVRAAGWETEVVVCDNNSTDKTGEIARSLGAKVVFEPVNQIARSRNTGAAAATGDWLLFVDADSRPSPELLDEVRQAIATGKYLFGGATIRFDSAPFAPRMTVNVWNTISRVCKYAAGSFIFCEAAAFREVGGFSSTLFAGEELDLSKRLKVLARKRGKRAIILHRHSLVTSARKLHLYTTGEHLRFMTRAFIGWNRILGSREECHIWYDGRR